MPDYRRVMAWCYWAIWLLQYGVCGARMAWPQGSLWRSDVVDKLIVISQGKGGVGKTSLTANLGGQLAAAGLKVLLLDLDPQGNLRRDLGAARNDGAGLVAALSLGQPLPIERDVRPGLDLVPGGRKVADLTALAFAWHQRGDDGLAGNLRRALTAVADDYDLILLDTPPGEAAVVEAAMSAARWLIIPTGADYAGLDGLELTAERFTHAQAVNPDLELLGVVLFGIGTQATAIERQTRAVIGDVLDDYGAVFDARIRYQQTAAFDARRRGLLVHELADVAATEQGQRLKALREEGAVVTDLRTRSASGLANDYSALAREVLARVMAATA